MITASLAILAGLENFGDLVNRIVGSNSKIGNFTILKFLFSHSWTKKINRKPTIPINPFQRSQKLQQLKRRLFMKHLPVAGFIGFTHLRTAVQKTFIPGRRKTLIL